MKILSPALSALAGVRHGFFARRGGVSRAYAPAASTAARAPRDDPALVRREPPPHGGNALGVAGERFVTC